MNITVVITVMQVILGLMLLVFSVVIALRTRSKVAQDLRGRWALLLAFLGFFILGYMLFLYLIVTGLHFRTELITGSIFLAGACFVVLVLMIVRTTIERLMEKELALKMFNDSLIIRTAELEDEMAVRMSAQRGLSESEQKYRSLVESTDDSIYVIDRNRHYIYMNEKHQRRLGLPPGGYLGRAYSEFHSPKQTEWFTDTTEAVFMNGKPVQNEYRSERDGRFFLQTMSPVRDINGNVTAVSVISKNITHLKTMEEELRVLSFTDELTGLYNRRGFFTLAEQQLKMANRLKKSVCLLYVDLDYLKHINDTLGHKEGDRALITLAEILRTTYRDSDIIARIGGDEFAVFPVEDTGGGIQGVTGRLKSNIANANAGRKNLFELSISTGIAYYDPERPAGLEELLLDADRAMYENKKSRSSQ